MCVVLSPIWLMGAAFGVSSITPTGDALEALVAITKLTAPEVREWFSRRRAALKRKAASAAPSAVELVGAASGSVGPDSGAV